MLSLNQKPISVGDTGTIYSEHCIVRRLIPHGTYFNPDGSILNPQPAEFDARLNRYIGDWIEAEIPTESEAGVIVHWRYPASYFVHAPLPDENPIKSGTH